MSPVIVPSTTTSSGIWNPPMETCSSASMVDVLRHVQRAEGCDCGPAAAARPGDERSLLIGAVVLADPEGGRGVGALWQVRQRLEGLDQAGGREVASSELESLQQGVGLIARREGHPELEGVGRVRLVTGDLVAGVALVVGEARLLLRVLLGAVHALAVAAAPHRLHPVELVG